MTLNIADLARNRVCLEPDRHWSCEYGKLHLEDALHLDVGAFLMQDLELIGMSHKCKEALGVDIQAFACLERLLEQRARAVQKERACTMKVLHVLEIKEVGRVINDVHLDVLSCRKERARSCVQVLNLPLAHLHRENLPWL